MPAHGEACPLLPWTGLGSSLTPACISDQSHEACFKPKAHHRMAWSRPRGARGQAGRAGSQGLLREGRRCTRVVTGEPRWTKARLCPPLCVTGLSGPGRMFLYVGESAGTLAPASPPFNPLSPTVGTSLPQDPGPLHGKTATRGMACISWTLHGDGRPLPPTTKTPSNRQTHRQGAQNTWRGEGPQQDGGEVGSPQPASERCGPGLGPAPLLTQGPSRGMGPGTGPCAGLHERLPPTCPLPGPGPWPYLATI